MEPQQQDELEVSAGGDVPPYASHADVFKLTMVLTGFMIHSTQHALVPSPAQPSPFPSFPSRGGPQPSIPPPSLRRQVPQQSDFVFVLTYENWGTAVPS
jgi:hypothetical protein